MGEIKVVVQSSGSTRVLPLMIIDSDRVPALLGRGWLSKLVPGWEESLQMKHVAVMSLEVEPDRVLQAVNRVKGK